MKIIKRAGAGCFLVTAMAIPPIALAQTYTRTDTITYHDNLSAWVLGQQASSTNVETGITESRTVYDPVTALPVETYGPGDATYPGKLLQKMTYHADGTLASVSDGRDTLNFDTTVLFSDWKRGLPQNITFPDGKLKRALVDEFGQVSWVLDETVNKHCYFYDSMGRITNIWYPFQTKPGTCAQGASYTNSWNDTVASFQVSATAKYGLPAGHWRQQVNTSTGYKINYYDALWRPVVTETYDSANVGGTASITVTRYDPDGRVVFQSYPMRTLVDFNTVNQGTRTTYDALGRPTRVEQDSEYGASALVTITRYLPGFQTQVQNPRGYLTTTTYKTYDQPTTDWPMTMYLEEGARTFISRDVFGKPTSLVRSSWNGTLWATRSYTYDPWQRLCKTIEPETGSTVMDYDEAGNLAWSAAGLVLTDTSNAECLGDRAAAVGSGRAIGRTYDQRNRLLTLTFPDHRGDQVWTYEDDGLPRQITTTSDGLSIVNKYVYNNRRMVTSETLDKPNMPTWTIGYAYDKNGSLSTQTYGGETVSYAPNALGQATKATSSFASYATGVSYYPNGGMQQFTYGNGIVHTMQQNARMLPVLSKDAYGTDTPVLYDNYTFDFNGNVAAISDGRPGATGNRTMQYDGLDRLTSVDAPAMFGGTIAYTYDVLDNLETVSKPNQATLRYCYTNQRLTFIRTGASDCQSGSATTSLTYDVQGNLASKNSQTYNFDYGNRLRGATGLESYLYDGYGRRVSSWAPNIPGNYIYSMYGQDGVLRYQQDLRKDRTSTYVYLNGSLVATREKVTPTGLNTIKYQHTDALGTPVAVTDAGRNVIELFAYDPYGKQVSGPIKDGPGYTGHVQDAATGLTYMQQRYYDPVIGRFLSVDPVTADSATGANFNRYWYANNNPYTFTDPDGRCPTKDPCHQPTPWSVWRDTSAGSSFANLFGNIVALFDDRHVNPLTEGVASPGELQDAKVNLFLLVAAEVSAVERVATTEVTVQQVSSKGAPKPPQNFVRPTNPPQAAPTNLPEGHSVRVMPPSETYPNGYWVQTNQHGQPVNPSTGKPPGNVTRPEARAQTHVELPEE